MVSIPIKGRVGADGVLRLEIPTTFPEMEVEACVVLQPVAEPGWPPGFFEATAGQWVGEVERIDAQIDKDQQEIDRLKAETRAILAQLKAR